MHLFTTVFERLPFLWILVGLLFIATGLYLGFEYSLSFGYMIVGLACFGYGAALYVFRLWDSPKTLAGKRLSPNFISVGSMKMEPAMPQADSEQAGEQPAEPANS
jgi:hypothetical protein